MDLGLLFADEEEMTQDDNEWVSFPHKIIHEYIAACYLVQESAKDVKILLQLFPTWKDIKRHEEVYYFCIGSSSNARQASVFLRYFSASLSLKIMEKIKNDERELCHSGIYKNDTGFTEFDEKKGYSDVTELKQVLSAVSREAKIHGTDCTNPVCNKFIHVYPACKKSDLYHTQQSDDTLYIFFSNNTHSSSGTSDEVISDGNMRDRLIMLLGDRTQVCLRDYCVPNSVDDQILNYWFTFIFTQSLQTLYMECCTLPNVMWDKIGHCMNSSVGIKGIRLQECTGVTEQLIKSIVHCTTLTKLHLQDCELSDGMCEKLCLKLKHLVLLEKLSLGVNPIREHVTHITAAITAWGSRSPLKMLNLYECELPADHVPALFSAVTQSCPELRVLSIGGNHIGGCLPSLMDAVPALLQYLSISRCKLQPQDVASIAMAISEGKLRQLRLITFQENNLIDRVVEPLLQAANIHHHEKLEIDLRHNKLSNEFISRWSTVCRPQLRLYL